MPNKCHTMKYCTTGAVAIRIWLLDSIIRYGKVASLHDRKMMKRKLDGEEVSYV